MSKIIPQQLFETFMVLMEAKTWLEGQRVVETHPELLSNETDMLLEKLAQTQRDEIARRKVEVYHSLLQNCQRIGIKIAFIEKQIEQANEIQYGYDLRTGNTKLLDRSIAAWNDILNHPAFPSIPKNKQMGVLSNIGTTFHTRYLVQGQLEDLEKSILFAQQAIKLVSNSQDYPPLFSNLGILFGKRYKRTGQISDLNQAISFLQQAVALSTKDVPVLSSILNNLSNWLRERYNRTRKLVDLTLAATMIQESVKLSPKNPTTLNNLGIQFRKHYERTGEIAYLNQAIAVTKQAVDLTSKNSPELSRHLIGLSTLLHTRYEELRKKTDLEQAIETGFLAIHFTPSNSPDRPVRLNNLGNQLSSLYNLTKELAILEQGQRLYQNACQIGIRIAKEECLRASRNWGIWAIERQSWSEAIQAYSYGIEAMNDLLKIQLQRDDKEIWLYDAEKLYIPAAYAYLRSQQVSQAITTLEYGRAFILSESLERTRTDLEHLPELGHPNLYHAYQYTLNQIWVLENQAQVDTDRLRAVRSELDETIEQIRQIEGYENFLRLQPDFKEDILATMTSSQMVLVYTAVTPVGGVALIVQPDGQVTEVWLDDLNEQNLREKIYGSDDADAGGYQAAYEARHENRETWYQAIDDITRWLWDMLMGPIIAKLNALSEAAEIGNVVLIPQGLMGLLPLHAAWTEDDSNKITGRRYALDEFLFTYSPNARALKASRERALTLPDSIFVVDNPDPNNPLEFAGAEVMAALSHFPAAKRERLGQNNVSFQEVERCLAQYPVAHFATHGWASLAPLESNLSLGPGAAISLRAILNMRLKKARLAILSACETAIPGRDLPDEVVSLPTGLMQAGFAGVVGSLWAVDDFSAMLLIARFYELWRKKELSPAESLRQAQIWLRDSSRREKRTYFQAIRPDRSDRANQAKEAIRSTDYTHPYYWAAFSFTGV